MRGNGTPPVSSCGAQPRHADRSSSTGCGKRDMLFTHSTVLSPWLRTYASTDGLEPPSSW